MTDKDKPKKLVTCVRCAHITEETDEYCIRCGAPLHNRCTDEPGLLDKGCTKVNAADAAYCASCGQPTAFYKAGLVSNRFSLDD